GYNSNGETNIPAGRSNVVAIAAGRAHSLSLERAGVPPTILGPLSQTIFSGGTLLFRATAVGIPPLRYQWRWSGQAIVGATNGFLLLENVQTNQGGSYTVEVTDGAGAISSATVALGVREAAPEILVSPPSQVTYSGQTVTFEVTPMGSKPFFYQ